MLKKVLDYIKNEDSKSAKTFLLEKLEALLREYIIKKGYWGDNNLIINSLVDKTTEIILEKICNEKNEIELLKSLKFQTDLQIQKLAKQICSNLIKKQLSNINNLNEIKNLIKKNIDDDEKLTTLIKLKLNDKDNASGMNFEDKLSRHEVQLSKYGLTIKDAPIIEKAFINYKKTKGKNIFLIDECQYLFALFFGYNLSHKQISEYENNHILKIDSQRKSIEKLNNCLRSIFNQARKIKYGKIK